MIRKAFFIVAVGLVLTVCLHRQAHSDDHTRVSSGSKFGDARGNVDLLASLIVTTIEKGAASAAVSTNAQGHVSMPRRGATWAWHATAMQKIHHLRGLLKASSELGKKHASLLMALERASDLDRLRESEAVGIKVDRGGDYWRERLRELGDVVLPSMASSRAKYKPVAPQKADGSSTQVK